MDNRVDFMNNGDLVIDTYNAIAEKYYKEFHHDFFSACRRTTMLQAGLQWRTYCWATLPSAR